MAKYFVLDVTTGQWCGPCSDSVIRNAIAEGSLATTHPVLPYRAGAVPISAGAVPAPRNPVVGLLKIAGIVGLAIGGAYLLGKGIAVLTEKKTPAPRLPRRRHVDPETAAIRNSAKKHERNGALVAADIRGWPKPPVLNGHIPDVYANYGCWVVAEEYENDRSINSTHARRQHVAFSAWANRSARREYIQIEVEGGRGGRG